MILAPTEILFSDIELLVRTCSVLHTSDWRATCEILEFLSELLYIQPESVLKHLIKLGGPLAILSIFEASNEEFVSVCVTYFAILVCDRLLAYMLLLQCWPRAIIIPTVSITCFFLLKDILRILMLRVLIIPILTNLSAFFLCIYTILCSKLCLG